MLPRLPTASFAVVLSLFPCFPVLCSLIVDLGAAELVQLFMDHRRALGRLGIGRVDRGVTVRHVGFPAKPSGGICLILRVLFLLQQLEALLVPFRLLVLGQRAGILKVPPRLDAVEVAAAGQVGVEPISHLARRAGLDRAVLELVLDLINVYGAPLRAARLAEPLLLRLRALLAGVAGHWGVEIRRGKKEKKKKKRDTGDVVSIHRSHKFDFPTVLYSTVRRARVE